MKLKTLTLSLILGLAAASTTFAEDRYLVRVPANVNLTAATPETPAEPLSLTLSAEPLPAGMVGQAYSFNLLDRLSIIGGSGSHNYSDTTWSLKIGDALPPGLAIEGDRIVGTPTVKNEAGTSFELTGMYQDASGKQVYTIVVGGVALQARQIAIGASHACAITLSGGVKCWGRDLEGQLGNDTAYINQTRPVDVDGLTSGVVSIGAGAWHTCALTTAGGVKCWGADVDGQLGNDAALLKKAFPVNVHGLETGVKHLAVGDYHACAVTASGGVQCWGQDTQGQLGNDSDLISKPTPVAVQGLSSGVETVDAGNFQTCARLESGEVKCWGRNLEGQMGANSTLSYQSTPAIISGLPSNIVRIEPGMRHTCLLTSEGGVKCWGGDDYGELGNDAQLSSSKTPQSVSGMSFGVKSLSSGSYRSCAVNSTGGVKCWGLEGFSLAFQSTPVSVSGLESGVKEIIVNGKNICAILDAGSVKCLGVGTSGQLGDGTTSDRQHPAEVLP